MSRAIAAALRGAANGPTPKDPEYLSSWLDHDSDEYDFALMFRGDHLFYALGGMTDAECRMFLLFCSYAAEVQE